MIFDGSKICRGVVYCGYDCRLKKSVFNKSLVVKDPEFFLISSNE